MTAVEKGSVVAVTGAAGFVGGHVVQEALARGYQVRACVRNVDDDARVGFLKAMNPYASGRLTLHAADLDEPGCFDEIFRGCDGVAHVSHVSTYDDPEYVRRTCDHIIDSVESSGSVRRVDRDVEPGRDHLRGRHHRARPPPGRGRGPRARRVEPEAHARARAGLLDGQGHRPARVLRCRRPQRPVGRDHGLPGRQRRPDPVPPPQGRRPWQHLIERMVEGRCEIFQGTGPYRPWMTVDVRDDAACHVGLLESDKVANGERYIAMVHRDAHATRTSARRSTGCCPSCTTTPGPIVDPSPDRWKEREDEFRSIWDGLQLRNDRIRAAVPITFRPLDDSIRDCVESLLAVAHVVPNRRAD